MEQAGVFLQFDFNREVLIEQVEAQLMSTTKAWEVATAARSGYPSSQNNYSLRLTVAIYIYI